MLTNLIKRENHGLMLTGGDGLKAQEEEAGIIKRKGIQKGCCIGNCTGAAALLRSYVN